MSECHPDIWKSLLTNFYYGYSRMDVLGVVPETTRKIVVIWVKFMCMPKANITQLTVFQYCVGAFDYLWYAILHLPYQNVIWYVTLILGAAKISSKCCWISLKISRIFPKNIMQRNFLDKFRKFRDKIALEQLDKIFSIRLFIYNTFSEVWRAGNIKQTMMLLNLQVNT